MTLALSVAAACLLAGMVQLFWVQPAHAAAPTMTAVTADTDGNGTVDRITITFSEAADLDDGNAGDGFPSLALSAGCTIAAGDYNNDSTTTLTLSGLTGCTSGDTSITPTVTYTAVANCTTAASICDAAGSNQMANGANTTATDGAAPQIKTMTYQDADADGKIDTFLITYTESTAAGSVLKASHLSLTTVGDFTAAAFGSATTDIADGGTTDSVTLGTESTAKDTAEGLGTIAFSTITGDGTLSITDGTTANTSVKAQTQATFADGAAPQIITATYQDNDIDGKIDRFVLAYSETVTAASTLRAADLLFTNDGDFDGMLFGGATTDLITGSVSSTTIDLGTESTAQDTASAVTVAFSSQSSFSLTEGTNTNSTLGAQAQITVSDGAGPVLISSSPTEDQAAILKTASIVLTFSEEPASITASVSPSVTLSTSISTVTVTITHTGVLASGLNTLTISTAPDSASNAFAGAEAGDTTVESPLHFTVKSSDSSSDGGSSASETVSSDEDFSLEISSPAEDDAYEVGDVIDVAWTYEGTLMAYVNLYYSDDDGESWILIAENQQNDGVYTWTPEEALGDVWLKIVGTDLVDELATDTSGEFSVGTVDEDSEDEDSEEEEAETTGETGVSPYSGEEEDINVVEAGDYIRGENYATVYFIEDVDGDLVRRPFYDAQTYFTYEDDFDGVVEVTDATLPTLTLGSPMLPNPGVVLVKIQSDARVFALVAGDGGAVELRWIASEEVAVDNYGGYWADYVIDIAPTLFTRFEMGDDIDEEDISIDTSIMKTRVELGQ